MKSKKSPTRFFLLMIISILSLIVIHCAVPPGQVIRKDGKLYGKKKKQWKVQWLKFERFVIFLLMVLMAIVVFLSVIELAWIVLKDMISPPFVLLKIDQLLEI